MTKKEFYHRIMSLLPIERKNTDFLEDVKSVYKEYISCIDALDTNVFKNNDDKLQIRQRIQDGIKTIQTVIRKYMDGCQDDAYKILKTSILNQDGSLKINVISIDKTDITGKYFYRARKDDGTISTYQDMFHISNRRRDIIKTQRYSALGFPCLYLGNTVYDCWEEMNRPQLESLYVSAFKVVGKFAVYDLRKPKFEDFVNQDISNILERLVFVIACQFKVYNNDGCFKPEYIIPQLIMGLILSSNRKKKECECGPNSLAWGVAYTSTHLSDDYPYKEDYLENIALPVVDTENEYCGFLTSLFMISDPILNRNVDLTDMNAMVQCNKTNDIIDLNELYDKSLFGFIEKQLKNSTHYHQSSYIYFGGPDKQEISANGGCGIIKVYSNDSWTLSIDDIKQ